MYKYAHESQVLGCSMKFSVYLPPQYTHTSSKDSSFPALYFLSGLTCTEDNFITKSGAVQYASQLGIVLICPDTSPRGLNLPNEDTDWDFGTGAGFYLNATKEPFHKNYKMYSYVTQELPELIESQLRLDCSRIAIIGHSMV